MKLFADQLRYTNGVLTGDGGSGDSRYGNTSAAFDQIGWGTMMFYRGEYIIFNTHFYPDCNDFIRSGCRFF